MENSYIVLLRFTQSYTCIQNYDIYFRKSVATLGGGGRESPSLV